MTAYWFDTAINTSYKLFMLQLCYIGMPGGASLFVFCVFDHIVVSDLFKTYACFFFWELVFSITSS